MKQITLLQVFFMLFSCFSRKELMMQQKPNEGAEPDSISNYFLFDYISSLTAADYAIKLDSIKQGESNDFFTLRMAYTKTSDYSPCGSDIGDSLKQVVILIDSLRFEKALSILKNIQNYDFVNIKSDLY